ncbi:hypothetical protein M3Y96_00991900 [Aphelenchoides besseyi]|nr:hypothetical protein M3Y96_00991900 [Aphelenchoides besseyi]
MFSFLPPPFAPVHPRPRRPVRAKPTRSLKLSRCPMSYREYFCLNGGKCLANFAHNHEFTPFCRCAPNYRGRRCEQPFDSSVDDYFQLVGAENGGVRQFPITRTKRFASSIGTKNLSSSQCIFLLFGFFLFFAVWLLRKKKSKSHLEANDCRPANSVCSLAQ